MNDCKPEYCTVCRQVRLHAPHAGSTRCMRCYRCEGELRSRRSSAPVARTTTMVDMRRCRARLNAVIASDPEFGPMLYPCEAAKRFTRGLRNI